MASGKLQIHCFGLLWLLINVYVVRISSTAGKRSPVVSFSLIIQRPRFAGGLLTIPLDGTVHLIQCSTKDVAQNIIRLQLGPNGKHLVMRATNRIESEEWVDAIACSLPTPRASTKGVHVPSGSVDKRASQTASCSSVSATVATSLPTLSLDAIKRLADGYDYLALQWTQAMTETRQFNAQISTLQPPRCDSAAHCAVYQPIIV